MTSVATAPATMRGRPMLKVPSGPGTALARFLIENIPATGLSNEEIAHELGYARANIVSAWKTGTAKFTLDNLYAMAEILKVDPSYMLALYIDQYVSSNDGVDRFPEIVETLSHVCTKDEWEIIKTVREARRGNSFPARPDQKEALKKLFEEPVTTPKGPYEPLETMVVHMGDRRAFKRRGHHRDMTISEVEEAEALLVGSGGEAPKKVRKRSVSAKD